MCDYHSTAWRLIGQEIQCAHLPNNSHSEIIEKAGWKANEPNRKIVVFEAEWNCIGEMPPNSRLIRNNGECPEKLANHIRRHYERVKEAMATGKHLADYFSEFEKWADVWARVTSLPENVTFPKECGYLYLSALTSLPENVTFPKECGYLDLREDLKAILTKRKRA